MNYDIIIATRNRLPVLQISLPLMLAQDRLPERLIIVDSSEDHAAVRKGIEEIIEKSGCRIGLEIFRTGAGSSFQRNYGIRHARAPVVFIPDDDSLWFRGLAEKVMRIYERDRDQVIGAVCPAESAEPPADLFDSERKHDHRLRAALGGLMNRFEKSFLMDPIYIEGFSRVRRRQVPAWLAEENAGPFGPMTGFQMSFRTDLIRKIGFDECLGRYSLMEDRDASLHVLGQSLIVCREDARVCHFKTPGKRAEDFEWGLINILNRAYVVCKHTHPGDPARRMLPRYSLFRFGVYCLRAGSPEGRRRIQGAWRGIRCLPELMHAPQDQAREVYLRLRNRHLKDAVSSFEYRVSS